MADLLDIGLATYQKAEAGECVDKSIAQKIARELFLDESELGIQPCAAAPPVDTKPYLEALRKECAWIDVRGLIVGSGKAPRLPIEDVFIPLRATGGEIRKGKGGREDRAALLEGQHISLDDTLTHRRLVIIGDPGGGKSTFLRCVAHRQTGPAATQFPILIRIFVLEEFIHKRVHAGLPDTPEADSADWIPRFLEDRSREFGWGLDIDFFRRQLREPSTLILLDGLDEVPNAARREAIARLFERATRACRDARFVVTTRPAAYEGKATLDEFETVRIGDLDTKAVEDFLAHWSGFLFKGDEKGAQRHNAELLSALRARPEIRRMTRNPLMLTALAVIQWNDRRLPEQRADLYESILKWMSEAHNYPGRPQGQKCLAIFGALALGMQAYSDGRVKQIEKAEAAKIIASEFREAPVDHRVSVALEFLENELIDSGILVSRGASLEFWHLTFQEYLAARACADFDDPASQLLIDDRWTRQEWREVMLLVPGVLIRTGQKRVDKVFSAILDRAQSPLAYFADKARAAGLLGAALQDLRPSNYHPPDESRYQALLNEALAIFDRTRAGSIDLRVRLEAADALGQAGDPRLDQENWIAIPGGTFLIGAQSTDKSKPGYDPEGKDREGPVRSVTVAPFRIGRYPVTVQEFARFVNDAEHGYSNEFYWAAGGYTGEPAPDDWDEQLLHPNYPAANVTWFAAAAYCKWCGVRLPTEAEWEFAARGSECRRYPWGNEPPDTSRANYVGTDNASLAPVGLFPQGATPEDVDDMAGNVFDWTDSWFDHTKQRRVARGGCCSDRTSGIRAADRLDVPPDEPRGYLGFRCVRDA